MKNLIPCRFHIEVEAVLKSEGLRATKQRLNIWDELSSTDKHRDIETILKDLKKNKINVSRATLYRTIDVFVKHNLLKKITLDSGKFLYEHNKKTITPQHDHIVCEDCGEIFEFYDNNISSIENKIADGLNLNLTKRVHQLSGTCKDNQCSHAKN
jgi:Fur family ferric uptake transcriptional regulator|tara:strand:- start:1451 stop:1915 length:465 start_codon:yes stop_codon:yes gene_type:complete